MSRTATNPQPTGASPGRGKRKYKPNHLSHSIVEHPFASRSNEVDNSTLDGFTRTTYPFPPYFKQKSIGHKGIHYKDTLLFHRTATQPSLAKPTTPDQSSASAAKLSHPAVTQVTQPLPPSSYPSSNPSDSLDYVQSWLAETRPSASTLASTTTLKEKDIHLNGRKRKRCASIGLGEAALAVPLTREALKNHLKATMSSTQSSGDNVCSSYLPPDSGLLTTIAQNPFTPQKSTWSRSLTSPMDSPAPPLSIASKPSLATYNVRSHMGEHGIYRDKGILRKPALADFRRIVTQVVDERRKSGVKHGSEARFERRLQWSSDDNEDTVLLKLLPCIINDNRQVRAPLADHDRNNGEAPEGSEQQDQDANNAYVHEDFEEVGLQFSSNRQFAQTNLPNTFDDQGFEAKIARELAKEQGMRYPKPDRIYGLDCDQVPIPKGNLLRPETRSLITLVPNMKDAFFVIEGKASNGGNMTRAAEQACRAGTCLVFSQRQLLAWTGHEDVEGPDERTYIYSATMDANCMMFWVHFAVVTVLKDGSKDVNFYMEWIYSKTYRENDALLYLRGVCHNILDWGVGARKKALGERYKQIIEFDGHLMKDAALRSKVEATAKAEEQRAKKRRKRDDNTSVTTTRS